MTGDAALANLKARYIARLKDVVPELRRYAVHAGSGGGPADLQTSITSLAHKLSGSGYTMGYPGVSTAAAGFEAILELSPPFAPATAAGARKLADACEAAIATMPDTGEPPPLIEPPPVIDAGILVIGENAEMGPLLTGLETRVTVAGSCQEALQFLSRGGVRLLVADLDACRSENMPELFAKTRAGHVPVLALASRRRLAAAAHVLSDGHATSLIKPADKSEFSAKVRTLLGGRRSVILGDDDKIVREFLKTRFEARGFEVILAGDGEEALSQARRKRPSIIVLDRAMPKLEGLVVLRMLRADPVTHDVPVVMLTQKSRPDQVSEGMSGGANAYMLKPFSPDAVVDKCLEILDGPARAHEARVASFSAGRN